MQILCVVCTYSYCTYKALLDKFQIEIRKKKKKKKTEWKRTACLYHSNVIIISTIMLKVLRLSSKIKSGFTVPLLSEA